MPNDRVLNWIAKECLNYEVVKKVKPKMTEIIDNYTVFSEIVEIACAVYIKSIVQHKHNCRIPHSKKIMLERTLSLEFSLMYVLGPPFFLYEILNCLTNLSFF